MDHRHLLLCALVLGGCLETSSVQQGQATRMPHQSEAFALVQASFAPLFPGHALAEPEVRWWNTKCPNTNQTAVILSGMCYSGVHYRPQGTDVAWRGTVGASAYSHELMHFFLKQTGQDEDANHKRDDLWSVVRSTDVQIQNSNM